MKVIDVGDLQHMVQHDPMGELPLFIDNYSGQIYRFDYISRLKVILFG